MQELIAATKNEGKLREIKDLFKDLNLKITSLRDYPDIPVIEEDGKIFVQNAIKKAATVALYTKKLTLGEDSGLEVKALKNRPGIYSSRFSGEGAADKKNNLKLLRELKGIPLKKRQARYRCYAALVDGSGIIKVVSGSCEGLIALHSKGKHGFGYDSLFLLPEYNKTFGQIDLSIKQKVSHRAKALDKMRKTIEQYLKKF